jgi:hypothetical protein
MAAGLFCVLFVSGCGVIDRLTSADGFAIQRFTVDQQTVAPGTAVTLSWDVEGAEAVEIDNGVGRVTAKGSKQLRPEITTSYTLTARSETSVASATVQVVVRGSSPPPPALPTPAPAPTPTPGPSPSPTPPATDPNQPTVTCGARAPAFGSCALGVSKGPALAGGSECVEITSLALDGNCPVAFATPRKLEFEVTARVAASRMLTWRRARASADVLTPATGTLVARGRTRVQVDDLALGNAVVIEIVDGDSVLLTFSVGHD